MAGGTALALCLMVAAFNALVDPFGTVRWLDRPGLNAYKPAGQTRVRLVKAFDVRRMEPRVIALGTSRTHVGLRMSHPAWPGSPRYNLAFDGATPEEMYAYLRHAQAVRPLSTVVLGLDAWHLQGNPSFVRPDFDPTVLLRPHDPLSLARADLADARLMFSLDTLQASVRTLTSQAAAGPDWFSADGQRLGPVFFHRPGEEFEVLGPARYFALVDRREIGFKLPEPEPPTPAVTAPTGAAPRDSFDYIRLIVAFCRTEAIDLRIYITPEHAHQLEISALMDEWPEIERGKRKLAQLMAEDAKLRHARPYPVWDFNGYSSVTTESVPVAGDDREMRFYWDSSHFKQEVGDWVLDRLFGVDRPGHPIPSDFGRPLDAGTVESVLAEARRGRVRYEMTHPDDMAALRASLIAATRERTAPHQGAP